MSDPEYFKLLTHFVTFKQKFYNWGNFLFLVLSNLLFGKNIFYCNSLKYVTVSLFTKILLQLVQSNPSPVHVCLFFQIYAALVTDFIKERWVWKLKFFEGTKKGKSPWTEGSVVPFQSFIKKRFVSAYWGLPLRNENLISFMIKMHRLFAC